MLSSCGKDGKGRKEKSRGEKESEREPVLKTGKGYISGEEMLASCDKDGKGRKEKSRGEKESEREPVPKAG